MCESKAEQDFGGSEKGQTLISAYRSLAITASTSGFEKLSTALLYFTQYRVCQTVDKNQRPSSAFRVGQVQPILLVLLPVEPWRVGSTSTTPQIRRKV